MPNRILRDGILTSERVNELDDRTEVFYRRLMSVVDDFGRYYAKPELIICAAYPLRMHSICVADVQQMLSTCVARKLTEVYEIDGKRYLQITDFRQQIRAKASKFPGPEHEHAKHMRSTCVASAHLDVDVDVDEVGDVDEPLTSLSSKAQSNKLTTNPSSEKQTSTPSANKASRGERLPDDWALDDDLLAWSMNERPDWDRDRVQREVDTFRDYWKAASGQNARKRDWSAAWRIWLRRATQGPRNAATGRDSRLNATHAAIEDWANGGST
jgi:hypothetical protein